ILHCLELIETVYTRTFEMPYDIDLSTRPEKFMGDPALWDRAEDALRSALERAGRSYRVSEGEGAFYGPKLDFHVTDSLGRRWQCATVQLDFQFPERFDLTYTGEDGQLHRPVMIHRAIIGSLERFIGVLIEHYGGAFPTWLAPVQARVIPVADAVVPYAREVAARLKARGLRVEVDERNEKMGWKIRQAQLEKIPYMLVVGAREAEAGTVSVRHRSLGDLGVESLDRLAAWLEAEVRERRNQPAVLVTGGGSS
ncbi:MAG TPA: threonine--tRNA ligase, partial [Bacillota bacterium]